MPNSDLKKFSFDPQGNPVYELYSDQQKPPTAASTTTPQQSIAQRAPEEIGSALGVQPPVGIQPQQAPVAESDSGNILQRAINSIGGGISKAANAAATPKGQEFLGGLGQALTATAPQSWQYQLGGQVREGAKSQMQNALYGKVLSGEKLTAEDFAGMPSDVVQNALALDEQMKSGVAARTYQKEIGGSAIPWEVRASLEMAKLNAPGTTSEDFRDVAIDQNGQFTGDQLHTYRRNAQGGYDYFGPKTRRAEPVGGGGESERRLAQGWWDRAYDRAIEDPRMQAYGEMIIDPNTGKPTIQWKDPIGGQAMLRTIASDWMQKFNTAGEIPDSYLKLIPTDVKPPAVIPR